VYSMIDWSRLGEVLLITVVAFAATIARVCFGVVSTQDLPPDDAELCRIWKKRMAWALVGELAAIVVFVLCAEAIVMLRGYSGPAGVLMGAAAAVLGYPFLAGLLRKRVASRLNNES
jgi:hypothetical protein